LENCPSFRPTYKDEKWTFRIQAEVTTGKMANMKYTEEAKRPNRPPTHPGAILREDVLPALDLSVSQAARDLRISRQGLHRILAEEAGISPEMALKVGRLCGAGRTSGSGCRPPTISGRPTPSSVKSSRTCPSAAEPRGHSLKKDRWPGRAAPWAWPRRQERTHLSGVLSAQLFLTERAKAACNGRLPQ